MKGVDRVVAHLTYYVTKQPLAPCDVISNAPAINRRGVFSVYFITSLTSEYLPVSLSTVVLNSRDCHENLWLPNFSYF